MRKIDIRRRIKGGVLFRAIKFYVLRFIVKLFGTLHLRGQSRHYMITCGQKKLILGVSSESELLEIYKDGRPVWSLYKRFKHAD